MSTLLFVRDRYRDELMGKATKAVCSKCQNNVKVVLMYNGNCPKCGIEYNWEEIEIKMPGVGVLRKYTPVFKMK